MKKYFVKLECHTINSVEVEADNEEEAEEIAKDKLRGMCSGDGMDLYEIEEIKN